MTKTLDDLLELAKGRTGADRSILRAALRELIADAERYRWLSAMRPNSFTLTYNDDHATNYMTAEAWINEHPEWFGDVSNDELQRMKDTNTIWGLQVYPYTPIGFNVVYGATLDSVVDA